MLRATLLMIAAMSLIPLGDAAGKMLTATHGVAPVFVGWSRFALGALLLLPFLRRRDRDARALRGLAHGPAGPPDRGRDPVHPDRAADRAPAECVRRLLRGADPVLRPVGGAAARRVRPVQAVLLAVGFAGVLLVVKPGFGMTPGLALAVLAGGFYGCYLVASRWLSGAYPPRMLLMSQLVPGAVVLAPFALATGACGGRGRGRADPCLGGGVDGGEPPSDPRLHGRALPRGWRPSSISSSSRPRRWGSRSSATCRMR
jgi:hypothetical protein